MPRRYVSSLVLVMAASACSAPQRFTQPPVALAPAGRFDRLARGYFDGRFRYSPLEATSAGVHTFDAALDDLSPEAVARFAGWLAHQRDALDALLPELPADVPGATAPASDHPRLDARILRDTIALDALRLGAWREYAQRPSAFHQAAADAAYQLMVRDFAPLDTRIRNATARLRGVPALLADAERWLEHPPRLAVEVALREIPGSIEMVREIFPRFADRATAQADRAAAREVAQRAADALERYRDFLQNTLLARATGDYHDGRERWITRARLAEGVTETPEQIRDGALAEVRRLQAELRVVAPRVARPGETVQQLVERQRHVHPPAAGLLDAYRARQSEVRGFVRDHRLATIDPARDDMDIQETPAFLRATVFASLSSPGPLEQVDRHTIFYVTPADLTRPAREIDEYLTEHSTAAILVTTVHEAYPGHHVQGIHQRTARSLVRQVLWQSTYGEGWAHYCEQMMVDEGLGDDTIRVDEIQEALLRAARAYLDAGVHVFGLGYDDAVRFYREEAFMSQPGAEMEARRVCLNPATVFTYTYGKLAFYRLRHAVVDGGPRMPLGAFHDAVMDFGSAPLPLLASARFEIDLPAWNTGISAP
ncbi:MAG: DUF885 domain-containing protein [Deltaproteobacteria bacterium]